MGMEGVGIKWLLMDRCSSPTTDELFPLKSPLFTWISSSKASHSNRTITREEVVSVHDMMGLFFPGGGFFKFAPKILVSREGGENGGAVVSLNGLGERV